MPRQPKEALVTAEQLYELPDDGLRYELLRGMLVSEPRPCGLRGRTMSRLATLLTNFVRPRKLGVVYCGDSGFVLARHPDTVRGPDVAFLSAQRHREIDDELWFVPGAPDLAIEILSPSDRMKEVLGKVSDYLAAGSRIVWLVDPIHKEVHVFRSPFAPRILADDDVLDGADVLPEFSIRVGEIFEL